MNAQDFDDDTKFFIATSRLALINTVTPLTLLQRQELERLLKAADEHDHFTVQRLRKVISDHFQELSCRGDFARVSYRQVILFRFAMTFFMLVAREYWYGLPVCTKIHFPEFILAKGSLQQRQQAADSWADGDLQALNHCIKMIYEQAVPELLLEEEYLERRLWAAHRDIRLADRLQEAGDWENLLTTLDQDKQTILDLAKFMEHQSTVMTNLVMRVKEAALEVIKERQSLARRRMLYKSLKQPNGVLTKVRELFDSKSGSVSEETTPLLNNKFLIPEKL